MQRLLPRGLGWHPDVPDFRDFSPSHDALQDLFLRLPAPKKSLQSPSHTDLRDYFVRLPPDQGELSTSSAHACVAMIEYFEYRSHGRFIEPSASFLYRVGSKLETAGCPSCCSLRSTFKAMVRLGIPPEDKWPEISAEGNNEWAMDPILYSFVEDYRSIRYVRLDHPEATGTEILKTVKSFLAAGFPIAFGFPVPNSLTVDGNIDYRPTFDSIRGGQGVVAVGYDDRRMTATKGALLIRSSWGTTWGENGYGWLPYVFVEKRLAVDFWTLLKPEWIATGEFYRPR